jgi:hypothetical protein
LPNQSLIGRIIEWSWKNVRFSWKWESEIFECKKGFQVRFWRIK